MLRLRRDYHDGKKRWRTMIRSCSYRGERLQHFMISIVTTKLPIEKGILLVGFLGERHA